MKKSLVGLLVGGVLAISSCGLPNLAGTADTRDTPAEAPVGTQGDEGNSDSPKNRTETGQLIGEMHEEVTNAGVTLTVNSVTSQKFVELEPEGRAKGSAVPEKILPKNKKAKFIKVATTVRNDGMAPWDLTCGYAIGTALYDVDGRRYEPINQLYRVPENPDCSDSLGPGFETSMTWIYEVPRAFEAAEFGFFDPEENYGDPSLVRIQAKTS